MIESPRRDLDEAIDRVAAKLVEVPADEQLLTRTIAQLPPRSATPWFLTLPAQATTAAAMLLLAFVWASPSRERTPRDSQPVVALAVPPGSRSLDALPPPRPAPIPPSPRLRRAGPDARSPIPPSPRLRRAGPDPRSLLRQGSGGQALIPDHERSLAPVDAIDALELVEIAPPAMELDATTALEPLVLPELALVPEGDS